MKPAQGLHAAVARDLAAGAWPAGEVEPMTRATLLLAGPVAGMLAGADSGEFTDELEAAHQNVVAALPGVEELAPVLLVEAAVKVARVLIARWRTVEKLAAARQAGQH